MFSTSVGPAGDWSDPPTHWSYSTLSEAESCPLRYALRHATYRGAAADQVGYPDKYSESALAGIVIHAAIEQIVRALRRADPGGQDEGAVMALRALGGYSKVIDGCIAQLEQRLLVNPRMTSRANSLTLALRRRAPEIRAAVQGLVTRLPVGPRDQGAGSTAAPAQSGGDRRSVGLGRHAEVRLVAEGVRIKGQLDLLTVQQDRADIVDFKSGHVDESHADQMIMYGLLWLLDDVADPKALPVGSLTIAYSGRDVDVPRPSSWDDVQEVLRQRVASADAAIAADPTARVSDKCTVCPVRHMCDAYWHSEFPGTAQGKLVDVEVEVVARNGVKSWLGRVTATDRRALIRTLSEDTELAPSTTLRLLDVACEIEPADIDAEECVVLTAIGSTEIFSLVGGARPVVVRDPNRRTTAHAPSRRD